MDTILTEKDAIGIVDPTANAPCLNPDGSPLHGPVADRPGGMHRDAPAESRLCSAARLLRPDADRDTARLRSAARNSTSGLYNYYGHANIRELALYVQDTITKGPWNFQSRACAAIFTTASSSANQVEPRLGIAYNIKPTNTVLRVSYARTLETPFNENLVLSSLGCNDPVINAIMASSTPCVTNAPAGSGLAQRIPRRLRAGLRTISSWWTASTSGSTPTAPTTSACSATRRSRFPSSGTIRRSPAMPSAAACRTSTASRRSSSCLSVAARFFTPQVSGIGATPGRQHGIPHRPRRELQPDHPPAIPALEERSVVQLQLALRQRPGGRPRALRGRQLHQRTQRDR